MPIRLVRILAILLSIAPLAAFRMPAADEAREKLVYDVRGAFVTAPAEVPQGLVLATDMLVDASIRATVRSTMVPRTIISVRIEETSEVAFLIGSRHLARVTVKAISVATGDAVAEGTFTASVFLLSQDDPDRQLAKDIADRIATAFRLSVGSPAALASASRRDVSPGGPHASADGHP